MAAQTSDKRLDSHHHLWTLARIERGDYHWMPEEGQLRDDHLPERLAPELERAGVGGTIVIQAAQTVDETRFLLDLARDTDFVVGVTGWAPLDRPDAMETLTELAENDYLRAIRPMIHDIPDRGWISRPQVRENLRSLAGLGLRFEALTYTEHLPPVYDALEEIPELPAVINHLSKPAYRWEDDEEWRRWMSRLAERPNTYCKLSGMLTEVGPGWTEAHCKPYVNFLFETFGAGIVMFGSDWPVSRQLLEYPDVVALTERLVSPLTPREAEAFWRTSAEAFYGVRVAECSADAGEPSQESRGGAGVKRSSEEQ